MILITENRLEDNGSIKKVPLNVVDLLITPWSHSNTQGAWVSVFQMCRIDGAQLSNGFKSINFGMCKVVLVYGQLSFQNTKNVYNIKENQLSMEVEFEVKETNLGYYLIVVTPADINGINLSEPLIKERIANGLALLTVVNGKNIAYLHVFDQIFYKDKLSLMSPVIENPFAMKAPDISDASINHIQEVYRRIELLPPNERERILLSLRWLNSGIRENGIDALLKLWIALETLGMVDTTNIRPLNESLSRAYGLTINEVQDRFYLRRILKLRSNIVHNGLSCGISAHVLDFLHGVYVDILMERLGFSCEGAALEVITQHPFSSWGIN